MQHVDLIAEYLLQLQRELAGVDAAVGHDALVDAEAHLRAAVAAFLVVGAAAAASGPAAAAARWAGRAGRQSPRSRRKKNSARIVISHGA
jgi:hypothetical protein